MNLNTISFSVVRTLLERSESSLTDSEDKEKEETHVEEVL